jgi:predicted metal-dependent hydrolase
MTAEVASLQYGGETIPYVVRRMGSRKTLGIEVHPDGRVLVRAPIDCPASVISERVRRRASWISRQRADFARYQPRTPQRQYVSGEAHLYLGRQYRLKAVSSPEAGVRLSRGEIIVTTAGMATPARVKTQLEGWYRARAREVFAEAVETSVRRFHAIHRPRLIIRTMQSRWGSLSRSGNMTLNVRLVQAPRACIEYVVAHELCHALHRDHNSRFYGVLDALMPDWRKRKERLEAALV